MDLANISSGFVSSIAAGAKIRLFQFCLPGADFSCRRDSPAFFSRLLSPCPSGNRSEFSDLSRTRRLPEKRILLFRIGNSFHCAALNGGILAGNRNYKRQRPTDCQFEENPLAEINVHKRAGAVTEAASRFNAFLLIVFTYGDGASF